MKPFIRILFYTLIFFYFSTIAFADKTIRITNGEWEPFLSENLKYYGVISRIVTEAFALEDVKVKYGFFPWKRGFYYAKSGIWDGTIAWTQNNERSKHFYFSDTLFRDVTVFFHKKDKKFNFKPVKWSDLTNFNMGMTIGYNYGENITKAVIDNVITIDIGRSDEINLKKLIYNRIDLFPISKDVGISLLNTKFSMSERKKITYSPWKEGIRHHLLLSKKVKRNEELLKLFNSGLAKLEKSGKIRLYFQESRKGEYLLKKR